MISFLAVAVPGLLFLLLFSCQDQERRERSNVPVAVKLEIMRERNRINSLQYRRERRRENDGKHALHYCSTAPVSCWPACLVVLLGLMHLVVIYAQSLAHINKLHAETHCV